MRRRATVLAAALATAALALQAGAASAHGLRTAYAEVVEVAPGTATVHLRTTTPDASLELRPGPGCTLERTGDAASAYDRAWRLDCPGGFTGRTLSADGLGPVTSDLVVWISLVDGGTASRIVRPGDATLELRPSSSGVAVLRQYVRLGAVHVLEGYDHLLFLLLLVLWLRTPRRVIVAETAFTLSHSASYTATALGWLRVSAPAAEACIALSLLLLAADVEVRGRPAPAARGATLALVFGLVHGLGFAGGLRELGLPESSIVAALVGFGAGVELGQVAFLAAVLLLLHLARRAPLVTQAKLAALYGGGVLSAYWLIERTAACVHARWG